METKEHSIVKPEYDSDIFSKIARIPDIEEEFNLNRVVYYNPEENKKVFIFADIIKGWVFRYTKNEINDEDTNNLIVKQDIFKDHKELLDYFKAVYVQFKENKEIWTSDLERRIKETKLLIESRKPSKIKELIKGETSINLNNLLYTSWGYDQTNTEMFRIVKFLGKNYFIIQEIGQEKIKGSDGFMCCHVRAGKQDLNKLPIKAFISDDGYISICETGYKRSLHIDEGKTHYKSWYA